MKKLIRNMKDPESREFWIKLEERVRAFDKRAPHWLKCDGSCKKCKKEANERKT